MAAPTQALPSWLSDSTSLVTDSAGQVTATFTTVVSLPLTYYGPPIPLGPDSVWVYGGLFPPGPSTSNPLSTSAPSSVLSSTLATPSSLTATPSTTQSSTSSPSPTSLSPISGESSHSRHVGEIIGAVLGSVLGSLLLLFLLIFFLRRRQHSLAPQPYHSEPPPSQVMWMWHDVQGHDDDQDADLDTQLHSAGEGSVQSSGDEHDAFLRRSGDASRGTRDGQTTARLVDSPRRSQDSSGPIGVALASSNRPTAVISREQLAEAFSTSPQGLDTVKSPDEAELDLDAPLLPPRTLNLNVSHGSRKSLLNSERSMTPGNDPESALLYTARRVQVGQSSQSSSRPSWPLGIPNILRRSWLNPKPRSTTPTTSSLKSTSFVGRQLTDNEVEAGRNHNAQPRTEMGVREGVRPISGISAFSTGSAPSGNTVFYDAPSRENLTSTPSPPIPPLQQGTASTNRSAGHAGPSPLSAAPMRASEESEVPAAYEQNTGNSNDLSDILDIPAPRPASPFASASLSRRPPGLFSSPNSNAPRHSRDSSDIHIEVLEEDPPAARSSWRQIAQGLQGLPVTHERRTTFGLPVTVVYPREPTVSQQGSLHSMRSHLGPYSVRSASGSAPASNTNSEHSRGGRSLKSLAQSSSSISSIDRRPTRSNPGEVSPPLSATGRQFIGPSTRISHHTASATVTSTGTRSSFTTHTSTTDPLSATVGVGEDGMLPPPPPRSWSGSSWGSPNHLHVFQNRVAGRDPTSHG